MLNVCRRRWVQRLDGLDREETIECVVKAHEVMDRNEYRTWNSETHTTAFHLLSVIKSFEFIANLTIIQRVSSYTRCITVKLQKIEMDIMKGYSEVNVIRTTVKEIRLDIDNNICLIYLSPPVFDQRLMFGRIVGSTVTLRKCLIES